MASNEKYLLQKTDSNRKLEFVQRLFRDRTTSIVAQKPETPWERAERSRVEQSTLRLIADQIGFRLKSFPFQVADQGQEHQVSVVKGGRIFKATFPGKFGLHLVFCKKEPKIFPATPSEYLKRILLQNQLFYDDIRLEGFYFSKKALSIITSQPYYFEKTPDREMISKYFKSKKFTPFSHDPETSFENKRYIIWDAHENNVHVLPNRTLMPFDVNITKK